MRSINSPVFSRNYGFWGETEQQALLDARIAIAGVGGDGFQLGLKLAQMGISKFSIADPETFEPENSNRVPGAKTSTYGRNKAEVFKDEVLDINPEAHIQIFTDGVQIGNVEEFMRDATLVLDESELTRPDIGTMIARQARKQKIPVVLVMNMGFAGIVTSFHPSRGKTFEWMMDIPKNTSLDEVRWAPRAKHTSVDTPREPRKVSLERCLPYLPYRYGDISSLIAIQNGAPLPSIAPGVDVATSLGEAEVLKHIFSGLNKGRWPKPVWAPRFRHMDTMTGKSGETRFPKLSYFCHVGLVAMRNKFGVNPQASYTNEDRKRRFEAHKTENLEN